VQVVSSRNGGGGAGRRRQAAVEGLRAPVCLPPRHSARLYDMQPGSHRPSGCTEKRRAPKSTTASIHSVEHAPSCSRALCGEAVSLYERGLKRSWDNMSPTFPSICIARLECRDSKELQSKNGAWSDFFHLVTHSYRDVSHKRQIAVHTVVITSRNIHRFFSIFTDTL